MHIADVSAFVKPGSDLDNAALQNSNSYYFPEKSYHMLPSELATKYCSLVPGENRLAVSLCFKLTNSGKILKERACLSIIKNKLRLTYKEVNDILVKPQKSNLDQKIFLLFELHKTLKKNRLKDGALDLVSTESIFSFDLVGTPSKIIEKKQDASHAMVEECMLLANKYAAKLEGSKAFMKNLCKKNKIDIIFGTHAIFQKKVHFKNLGLIIIDEQHKFGVNQRKRLSDKGGKNCDVLLMTATPIPRTLTMTLYGDMDLSIIIEKPKSRKPIKTYSKLESKIDDVVKFI